MFKENRSHWNGRRHFYFAVKMDSRIHSIDNFHGVLCAMYWILAKKPVKCKLYSHEEFFASFCILCTLDTKLISVQFFAERYMIYIVNINTNRTYLYINTLDKLYPGARVCPRQVERKRGTAVLSFSRSISSHFRPPITSL